MGMGGQEATGQAGEGAQVWMGDSHRCTGCPMSPSPPTPMELVSTRLLSETLDETTLNSNNKTHTNTDCHF